MLATKTKEVLNNNSTFNKKVSLLRNNKVVRS
jgi:hypothetical protein